MGEQDSEEKRQERGSGEGESSPGVETPSPSVEGP